jgi:hypothetical protein
MRHADVNMVGVPCRDPDLHSGLDRYRFPGFSNRLWLRSVAKEAKFSPRPVPGVKSAQERAIRGWRCQAFNFDKSIPVRRHTMMLRFMLDHFIDSDL